MDSYAYVGDAPANFVDPSGMAARRATGGPTGYVSTDCDGWAAALGICTSISPGIGGGTGGGGGGGTALTFSWGRCGLPIALFVVGLILSIAGLYAGDIMGSARIASYLTSASWENDLAGIVTGSGLLSVLSLIWDIGSYLIFDVIIPAMNWWEQVGEVGLEAAEWTPPGLAVHAFVATVAFGLGVADLMSQSCVPTNLESLTVV